MLNIRVDSRTIVISVPYVSFQTMILREAILFRQVIPRSAELVRVLPMPEYRKSGGRRLVYSCETVHTRNHLFVVGVRALPTSEPIARIHQ